MPSQPIGDRKPSQLWDEICMLSRLPETDEDSKNKEVDLKKEIWLQTLPSCVRVLLHNTDEMSMDDLSTLADEIMMSQNAARHDTPRCLPPDVMHVRRTPDVMPVRRTPDVMPVRRTPDVMPVRRTPDAMPALRPAETNTDDVAPVQRANWYANHNQFHATLESNGLCSYHNLEMIICNVKCSIWNCNIHVATTCINRGVLISVIFDQCFNSKNTHVCRMLSLKSKLIVMC